MHTYRLAHGHTSTHTHTPQTTETVHSYAAMPMCTDLAENSACLKPQTTPQLCKLAQSSHPMLNTTHKLAQTLAGLYPTKTGD